ncbi:Hypothetical predicted protein [Mytilus galloprovincialis]|uniref:Uncharacterized protein n=1 Tax=Mytilus galloprovincialis TaxID=29158 RepID=A0A8B6F4P2_MYTGA|nr:Hypothetical predicted protein [Mytilus galloprovincialis]
MATLDVRLKKVNKIYKEGDVVAGVIVVTSNGDLQHQGITLTVDGAVTLQLSAKVLDCLKHFTIHLSLST